MFAFVCLGASLLSMVVRIDCLFEIYITVLLIASACMGRVYLLVDDSSLKFGLAEPLV